MKRVTELIDVMNNLEEGDGLRIATEAGEHEGVVTSTDYEYPDAERAGSVRIEMRTDTETDESAPQMVVIETAAKSNTEKFARPRVRPADAGTEAFEAVVDIEWA